MVSPKERLAEQGLEVESVGDLIGGEADRAVKRVTPPILPGQAEFPEPGIYFGMPEEVYHSIHACSASGLKKLSVSSMDYWASSPLNPEREDDGDSIAKMMGRAYHVRICEGQEEFAKRYAVALEKDDFPADKLCITVADIRAAIDGHEVKPKGTSKEGLIEQLLDLDPDALIWDRMVAKHAEENEGKVIISAKLHRRIQIAAAMIYGDPQLKDAFVGGHAEVSVFWYDDASGAPMKARFDYLKMNTLVDLKSFSNMQGKPVQRAIDSAISNQKYFIPVVVYLEAIAATKALVKRDPSSIFVWRDGEARCGQAVPKPVREWCWKWAHQPEPDVLFVFQQTGIAPVTRGRIMGRGGHYTTTQYAIQFLKRKWVRCAEAYGTMPWIDFEPVTRTEEDELPPWGSDFGDTA